MIVDFGWRAMHISVLAAKVVIAEYYGRPASKSYYLSCSSGGRQGLGFLFARKKTMLTVDV
jgi:feruloyl esterase